MHNTAMVGAAHVVAEHQSEQRIAIVHLLILIVTIVLLIASKCRKVCACGVVLLPSSVLYHSSLVSLMPHTRSLVNVNAGWFRVLAAASRLRPTHARALPPATSHSIGRHTCFCYQLAAMLCQMLNVIRRSLLLCICAVVLLLLPSDTHWAAC